MAHTIGFDGLAKFSKFLAFQKITLRKKFHFSLSPCHHNTKNSPLKNTIESNMGHNRLAINP
jgi:hypothetical protein